MIESTHPYNISQCALVLVFGLFYLAGCATDSSIKTPVRQEKQVKAKTETKTPPAPDLSICQKDSSSYEATVRRLQNMQNGQSTADQDKLVKARIDLAKMEIEQLRCEIDLKTRMHTKRPRRKIVTASSTEGEYATYMEAWRKKVEKIGNLNYPEEAKSQGLYGNLLVHVAIRADGTIRAINIKRSSGHKVLDDAVISITRLAAPFEPFPDSIRKETEIVDIIRTWQFVRQCLPNDCPP